MFDHLKVGDEVTREFPANKNESGQEIFPAERDIGRIIQLTDTVIIVEILIDVPRTFVFDRTTGIDMNGEEYGKLFF